MLALEADRRVEVAEGRGGRGVGVVVGGHEDGLEARDGALLRRRDPLLEGGHLRGQVRLVADRRRHPPEQGGNLGPGLGETEDVVDEEEDVAALGVAEMLRHGEGGEPHPQAGAGRLVHLAEDEGRLGDDAGLGHLADEVVSLARALPHAREDGDTSMLLGDVADQLLDDDRLAHAGAAEDADLAALLERADQVDDLEARLEDLDFRDLLVEGGRRPVDREDVAPVDRPFPIDGVAQDVEHATEGHLADRDRDRAARVQDGDAAGQAVGRGHGHGPHPVVPQVLLDLADQRLLVRALDLHRVVDRRKLAGGEFDVDDRSGDLDHAAGRTGGGGRHVVPHASVQRPARAPVAISTISRVMFAWRTLL